MKDKMKSRILIILLFYHLTVLIWAQQNPLELADMCISYVDCGVTDVTPQTKTGQRFRLLPSTENSSVLHVGALEGFVRIDPSCTGTGTDPWIKMSSEIQSCQGDISGVNCTKLNGDDLRCNNYIRVVEKTNSKLLVCGTRAAFPRCYGFEDSCDLTPDGGPFDGRDCSAGELSYDAFDQYSIGPRLWNQNITLGYFGGYLFTGSTPEVSLAKTKVQKIQLTNIFGSTGDPFAKGPETYVLEDRSVNEANFIGRPFKYTMSGSTFVLFFFREAATEHINQGKIVYSRVARVCQGDTGNNWSSYIKARLTCSHLGDFPDYFNDIQDYFAVQVGGETYFYAVFARPPLSSYQSAVCVYRLSDIHNIFQTSQFRTSTMTSLLWAAVAAPSPRPGANCSNPSTDTTFHANTLLMDTEIENYNYKVEVSGSDQPLFYLPGEQFSSIVVDNRGTLADNVIFVGTEGGEIWKVTDNGTDLKGIIYWRSDDGTPVTGLGLIKDGSKVYLYASSYSKILKIDLQYGKAYTQDQFNTIYSPYLASSAYTTPSGAIASTAVNNTFCNGEDIQLTCQGRLDPSLGLSADTKWMFTPVGGSEVDITASSLGHFITFNKVRSNVANPLSYLLIRTHTKTSGTYRCIVFWGATEESQMNTVTVTDCVTTDYKTAQDTRKTAAVTDAESNRMAYDTANMAIKLEPATCPDCPWN